MNAPIDRASRLRLCLGLGVGLCALVAVVLPRTIQPGDAGEFSTVMLGGGVPHPSGYPWMRMLGPLARAMWHLGLPPASAAALPCALAGVAGLLVLADCLARRIGVLPSAWAVALVGTSGPFVRHVFDAEVWGLHVLFCSLVIAAVLAERPSPVRLGLAIGVATSHHLTAVLLVPAVVAAALPPRSGARGPWLRETARAGAIGLACAALGLLPYLTLMLGDDGAWRWGDTQTWSGLVHHVSRADYGTLQLSLHETSPSVLDSWLRAGGSVGRALVASVPLHALAGTAAVLSLLALSPWVRPPGVSRRAWTGLGLAALASAFGFPALSNLDPESPFAAWILERFDVLTLVLLAPVLASSLAIGISRLPAPRVGHVAAALFVAHQLVASLRAGVPSQHDAVQRYALGIVRTPDPERPAIVLGTDDHRTFPVLWAQTILGEGANVIYVDASLLAHPWYRARLRAQWPWLPDVDKPLRMVGAVWQDPEHRDTPVYLANVFSTPSAQLPRVPEGVLWRVPAPHEPRADPHAVFMRHLATIDRLGPPPTALASDPFASDAAAAWVDPTRQLAAALEAEGLRREAGILRSRLQPPAE